MSPSSNQVPKGIDENNGNVTINVSGKATIKADVKTIIDSPLIECGKDSTEPVILGDLWKEKTIFKEPFTPSMICAE